MGAGHAHGHDDHGGHSHGHHHHAPPSGGYGRAFGIGILLNLAFVGVEGVYGILSNSMALVADAGHNLSDVLGLVMAWGAIRLGRRSPSPRFTYGLRRSSILAALFNAVFLMVAVGAIAVEAIQRIGSPSPVATGTMMIVAGIGILVNGFTALLFAGGRDGDINIRGAFLHMAADAGVSAGVVIGGLVIGMTGWLWLDPAISLAIVALIVWGTWGLLRDSLTMALDGVPARIATDRVEARLAALPGVVRVHDLHIWPLSTTDIALTAHLSIPGGHPGDAFLHATAHMLDHDFGIGHATIQIETGDASDCGQGDACHG